MAAPLPALSYRYPVNRAVRPWELGFLALCIGISVLGATWLGATWFVAALVGLVGAVLGFVLPNLRPGGAEVRLEAGAREVHWVQLEDGLVVDERRVDLHEVVDALVMPQEGAGWGVEIHLNGENGRVRLWRPRLPLRSADEARGLVDWLRRHAPNASPTGRLPPMEILR